MSDAPLTPDIASAAPAENSAQDPAKPPLITIEEPDIKIDLATALGLSFSIGLIALAILLSGSDASFFDLPSVIIVIFGTMAATAIAYTQEELLQTGDLVRETLYRKTRHFGKLATALVELAVIAKKKGPLILSSYENELKKEKFLHKALQMVIDDYPANDVDFFLTQELEAEVERHKRSASIARRASEMAPAMGLIGTLVGLVQMLSNLENPATIGPAMALALLTTFYGAILGNVVLSPMAAKLEKRAKDESLLKTLIKMTAVSIARRENPRKLEIHLNSELPPVSRIRYFD